MANATLSDVRLLSIDEAAEVLGISRSCFCEHRAGLIANGLREVGQGRNPKYTTGSLIKLIETSAEKNKPLWK